MWRHCLPQRFLPTLFCSHSPVAAADGWAFESYVELRHTPQLGERNHPMPELDAERNWSISRRECVNVPGLFAFGERGGVWERLYRGSRKDGESWTTAANAAARPLCACSFHFQPEELDDISYILT